MSRQLFKRFMPNEETIKKQKYLRALGPVLYSSHLWHLSRNSVARAFAIGLFMAFVPLPFQMVLSAIAAIILHANLPLAVILVWFSNPVTMPLLFYFAYWVGTVILDTPSASFTFELSFHWLQNGLIHIWKPFLLGCFICGALSGLLGYTIIRLTWRWHVITRWRNRKR